MTRISLIRGDTTQLKIEAIVNAANESGLVCSILNHCIDSSMHFGAGPKLFEECKQLGGVPTGVAKITNAYNLPSKYIIHVTGPQHIKGHKFDYNMLSKCYYSCLNIASKYHIKDIAFCRISTGLYDYPKKESDVTAIKAITQWCRDHADYQFANIVFNVFTDEDENIYKAMLNP
jgi:O-acetyl-ADP-ribose deacetylase (regulator of RNase III)